MRVNAGEKYLLRCDEGPEGSGGDEVEFEFVERRWGSARHKTSEGQDGGEEGGGILHTLARL